MSFAYIVLYISMTVYTMCSLELLTHLLGRKQSYYFCVCICLLCAYVCVRGYECLLFKNQPYSN